MSATAAKRPRLRGRVAEAVAALGRKGLSVSVAESCTGGMLAALITSVPGSSKCFRGGVVAYANDVKTGLLGVKASTIKRCGAVSEETAEEMARGVRERLASDLGISITGIAGPGGGTVEKPVGTVYVAVASARGAVSRRFAFSGSRDMIRRESAREALEMLIGGLATGRGN